MPWSTPTLREVRGLIRDSVRASLPGADASIPNSVLRVMSDNQGALCHLTLQYIDWLALQLLPDTSEQEWLDRHGHIWLTNADGTTGRKLATLAEGWAQLLGTTGTTVAQGARLTYGNFVYETTADVILGVSGAEVPIRALDPGTQGNLDPGIQLGIDIAGVDEATVIELDGGTDTESEEDLRSRVLRRIRQPPMGGAAYDYEAWALAVPGVTRAWCAPLEMGIGTVTVRIMMDELRADSGGFPLPSDLQTVWDYINTVRPVTVKDFWVEAPIPYPIDVHITKLDGDTGSVRGAIEQSLIEAFFVRAIPGQSWWRSWTDEGIAAAAGVVSYHLDAEDQYMPGGGYMPILGDITYG
jgi:uncharacterized phage protein gp47/JayE